MGAEDRAVLTDFRYLERAQREVAAEFERATAERELLAAAVKRLRGRVGYDDAQTSVKNLRKLEQLVPEGVELVAAGGLVERLRRHKDAGELQAIAEAARLADEVYGWVFDRGVVGRTEREIMLDAHQRMRELGADDPSFPAIVAAGENSALPHHSSSEREVRAGELLLIDMGAVVDGYCSDCTRTVAAGEIDDEAREVYELVRSAQAMALEAIRAGVEARDADSVARDPIARGGPRRALRPRARARGGARGPRGAARVPEVGSDARGRRRGHGRAGHLPPGPLRRPDRGPGDRHRGRLPEPQHLPKELRVVG